MMQEKGRDPKIRRLPPSLESRMRQMTLTHATGQASES